MQDFVHQQKVPRSYMGRAPTLIRAGVPMELKPFLGFKVTREKKYKLLFHKGFFKKKSIKVWYSKAQFLWLRRFAIEAGMLECHLGFRV